MSGNEGTSATCVISQQTKGATERYSVGGSQTSGDHLSVFDTAVLRTVSGIALYDNIQLTYTAAIPEPSSLALLGLGGLLMAGRRRRRRRV